MSSITNLLTGTIVAINLLTLRFQPNALKVITNPLNEQEVKELEDINSVITNTSAIAEDVKPQPDEESQNVDEEQEKDMEKENDTNL